MSHNLLDIIIFFLLIANNKFPIKKKRNMIKAYSHRLFLYMTKHWQFKFLSDNMKYIWKTGLYMTTIFMQILLLTYRMSQAVKMKITTTFYCTGLCRKTAKLFSWVAFELFLSPWGHRLSAVMNYSSSRIK